MLWGTVGILVALAVMQVAYVLTYLRLLGRQPASAPNSVHRDSPTAVAVILCMRGPDPSLERCVSGLVGLNYPDYELHFVVDDQEDPALEIVRKSLGGYSPSELPPTFEHVVRDHGPNGSLKCAGITAAVMSLDPRIAVVALVDADAAVDADWLSLLVAPFCDPGVGATTGNRWFAPRQSGLGSMVRKIWNAAALPQMSLYSIAWGGSLAIRRDAIDRADLLDRWSRAFCEDTMLTRCLAEVDLQVLRVPSLIVINRETCSVRVALQWIQRQLLTVQLYHASWKWVLGHAILGGLCLYLPPLLAMWYLSRYQLAAAAWLAGSWCTVQVVNAMLLQSIESANRRVARGKQFDDLACTSGMGAVANLVLQLVYPFLAIGAAFQQTVAWRGIQYRILPGRRIEMVEYQPFADAGNTDRNVSTQSIH